MKNLNKTTTILAMLTVISVVSISGAQYSFAAHEGATWDNAVFPNMTSLSN